MIGKDELLRFIRVNQRTVNARAGSFDNIEQKKGADEILDNLRELVRQEKEEGD